MGLMPSGTWEKLCLNQICAPPPNEKGGYNWIIIGDPPWTIRNMAVQNKKNCEHHNGKMWKMGVSRKCGKKQMENQKGKLGKMWEREKWEN